jgi:hypothetical protein
MYGICVGESDDGPIGSPEIRMNGFNLLPTAVIVLRGSNWHRVELARCMYGVLVNNVWSVGSSGATRLRGDRYLDLGPLGSCVCA